MNKKKHLIRRIIFSIAALLLVNVIASAQIDVAMTAIALNTEKNDNHWQISIGFNKQITIPGLLKDFENFQVNPIKNPKNFSLIDVESGQKLGINYIFLDTAGFYVNGTLNPNAGFPGELTIFLDPSIRLDPKKHYHLYVFNVKFNGQNAGSPPQSAVKFPANPNADNGELEEQTGDKNPKNDSKDSLSFTAADGREDSNIYISGQAVASKGSKPNFTGDIKVEIPFRKIIGNRIHNFNPFFELKVGQGPDVDPDTMKLGLNWEFPLWRYRGDKLQFPIRRILLKNAPLIEAEKDWDNVNFIIESRLRFMSRTYSGKNVTFYFRPFIGQELGKNLNSPVTAAKGKMLYRPLLGTTMNLVFPIQRAGIHDISFEGEYTRRWLLKREIYFQETDENGFQPLQLGRGPRDYLLTKFNLNFTKSFGLTLSFENGRLPPSFKTVNQKVSFGLTYKIKLE